MGVNRVRWVKFTVLLTWNMLIILLISQGNWNNQDKDIVRTTLSQQQTHFHRRQPNIKSILFWNGPRRSEMTIFGTGHDAFVKHKCPISDCEIVNSPYQYPDRPLESFDAIILNFNDEFWLKKRPIFQRQPHQRLIFFTQEPPPSIEPINITAYTNYFNWTMTYRLDSDVRLLYGRIRPKDSAPRTAEEIQARIQATHLTTSKKGKRRRRRLVAGMISHCTTDGRRENYIKMLKKHIKIDIYGACRDENSPQLICDTNELLSSTPECYNMLENNYMFYLSFENSICTDYVTEKFFQIMKHQMVPIVYGGANYEQIAPRHSYIDARKFKPKDLADYIRTLAQNTSLYNEYFWWKDDYIVEAGLESMARHGFCDLCQKLHQNNRTKSYDSLADSWDAAHCHRPNITRKAKMSHSSSWSPWQMFRLL